jgi:hypothetical protein
MADRNTLVTQFAVEAALSEDLPAKKTRVTQFIVEAALQGDAEAKKTRVTQFAVESAVKESAQFNLQQKSIQLDFLAIADPTEISGTVSLPRFSAFSHDIDLLAGAFNAFPGVSIAGTYDYYTEFNITVNLGLTLKAEFGAQMAATMLLPEMSGTDVLTSDEIAYGGFECLLPEMHGSSGSTWRIEYLPELFNLSGQVEDGNVSRASFDVLLPSLYGEYTQRYADMSFNAMPDIRLSGVDGGVMNWSFAADCLPDISVTGEMYSSENIAIETEMLLPTLSFYAVDDAAVGVLDMLLPTISAEVATEASTGIILRYYRGI